MQDEPHLAVTVDLHHCSVASAGTATVSAANSGVGEAAQSVRASSLARKYVPAPACAHARARAHSARALSEQRQREISTVREGHVSRLVASWQACVPSPSLDVECEECRLRQEDGPTRNDATREGLLRQSSMPDPLGNRPCLAPPRNSKARMVVELQKVLKRSNTEPAPATAAKAPGLKRLKIVPPSPGQGETPTAGSDEEPQHLEQQLKHQQQKQQQATQLKCCSEAGLATEPHANLQASRVASIPPLSFERHRLGEEVEFRMLTPKTVANMRQYGAPAPPRIVSLLDLGNEKQTKKQKKKDRMEKVKQEECDTTFSHCLSSNSSCAREAASWERANVSRTLQLTRGRTTTAAIALEQQLTLPRSFNTAVLGVTGGAAGVITGTAVGAVLGIPSAIMTLGLSIPVCSGAGAAAGLCAGGVVGATAGARGANVTIAYESQPAVAHAPLDSDGSRLIVCIESQGSDSHNRRHAVTMASAFGGSVVMGSLGGASGTAVGGLVGATTGLVAAPFTLGLSIPIGATIGTTMGFLSGTLAGATAGFFGGGMAAKGGFACIDMKT
mmetsp:Transcript_50680/g.98035  ORF Transcript_50680/g.98035 Transcript_50680/m.98035 type:complete len:559 (+) Transcript_50680:65-1741(+)